MNALKPISILLVVVAIIFSPTTSATTTTGNITISGTAEQTNSCKLYVPSAVNFGTQLNTGNNVIFQRFDLGIDCTQGLAYSVHSPQDIIADIGGHRDIRIYMNDDDSGDQMSDGLFGTGTGALENRKISIILSDLDGGYIPITTTGYFSKVIEITLVY